MSTRKATGRKVIDLMEALKASLEHDRASNPQRYCALCTHAWNAHGALGCVVASCDCKARLFAAGAAPTGGPK